MSSKRRKDEAGGGKMGIFVYFLCVKFISARISAVECVIICERIFFNCISAANDASSTGRLRFSFTSRGFRCIVSIRVTARDGSDLSSSSSLADELFLWARWRDFRPVQIQDVVHVGEKKLHFC
jgi:hypothetical protein